MTNREIAERVVAAVKRCQVKGKCDTCTNMLEKSLRDAEVKGLKLATVHGLAAASLELARLRAEESK